VARSAIPHTLPIRAALNMKRLLRSRKRAPTARINGYSRNREAQDRPLCGVHRESGLRRFAGVAKVIRRFPTPMSKAIRWSAWSMSPERIICFPRAASSPSTFPLRSPAQASRSPQPDSRFRPSCTLRAKQRPQPLAENGVLAAIRTNCARYCTSSISKNSCAASFENGSNSSTSPSRESPLECTILHRIS
jgi:hypothetical protein